MRLIVATFSILVYESTTVEQFACPILIYTWPSLLHCDTRDVGHDGRLNLNEFRLILSYWETFKWTPLALIALLTIWYKPSHDTTMYHFTAEWPSQLTVFVDHKEPVNQSFTPVTLSPILGQDLRFVLSNKAMRMKSMVMGEPPEVGGGENTSGSKYLILTSILFECPHDSIQSALLMNETDGFICHGLYEIYKYFVKFGGLSIGNYPIIYLYLPWRKTHSIRTVHHWLHVTCIL